MDVSGNTLNDRLMDCECSTVTLDSEISANLHVEWDCNCWRHSVHLVVGPDVVQQPLAKGMYVVMVDGGAYFVHTLAGSYYKTYQMI